MKKNFTLRLTFLLLLQFFAHFLQAQTIDGFSDVITTSGFTVPTGLTFDTNGRMYVWEKAGKVYLVENGVKSSTPLVDISEEVGNFGDYGLLVFALDPDFLMNGYVYLFYSVERNYLLNYGSPDYDPSATLDNQATIGRITRYQANASDGFHSVDYTSRKILVGESITTGFPLVTTQHGMGSLVFGMDGTLLASCGESAYFSDDEGSDGPTYYLQALDDGIIRTDENVGCYRSQNLNSLNGKIIRIDPSTGDAITSNPFYNASQPRSAQSRVWAYGFRNPFRFTLRPNTGSHNPADGNPGVLYVGDVGEVAREEIDVVSSGGQNFGWPNYEGMDFQPIHTNYIYTPTNVQNPAIQYRSPTAQAFIAGNIVDVGSPQFTGYNFTGNCSIAGVWYTGSAYPAQFQNTYFHADYGQGWIKNFNFDVMDMPTAVSSFDSSATNIVCLAMNPVDENLYYVDIINGEVHKIYSTQNRPPKAVASANVLYGVSPLAVQFDGSQSSDPENGAILYDWDFGDGSAHANSASPNHIFTTNNNLPTQFLVKLTVTDNGGATATALVNIAVNDTPPVIISTSIDNVNNFPNNANFPLDLTAQITDLESSDAQLTYQWRNVLHHNTHTHPDDVSNEHTTQFILDQLSCGPDKFWYEIKLTVTDPQGASAVFSKFIYPNCGNLTDNSPPTTPQNVNITNLINNSALLSWSASTDNVGINLYEVYQNGVFLQNVFSPSVSVNVANLLPNNSYTFTVLARDLSGLISPLSSPIVLNVPANGFSTCVNSSTYLSDLDWTSSTNTSGNATNKDLSTNGNTLTINGVTFAKGIGTHAVSNIVYDINKKYTRFKTAIGIDDDSNNYYCGSVAFQVFADNNLIYQSNIKTPDSAAEYLDLNITNVSQLKLVVTDGGDNIYCDHGDWAGATLEKICLQNTFPSPSAPANLVATNVYSNSLSLAWDFSVPSDTVKIISYEVFLNGVSVGTTNATTNNLNISATIVNNSKITVQAKDAVGNLVVSNTLVVPLNCPDTRTLQSPTDDYANGNTFQKGAAYTIFGSNKINAGANIIYSTQKSIILTTGFEVKAGSVFKAFIGGCQ